MPKNIELKPTSGAFSAEFAAKKTWKLDQKLLDAILATLPGESLVVDLGAGVGRYVQALRDAGHSAVGLDGIEGIDKLHGRLVGYADLTNWDVTSGLYKLLGEQPPEWALCIEVGEHVPQAKLKAFLDNICSVSSQGLIISWGTPGQRGRDHVSCRLPEWVTIEVTRRRWKLDHDATVNARGVAGKGWNRKLLVFRR